MNVVGHVTVTCKIIIRGEINSDLRVKSTTKKKHSSLEETKYFFLYYLTEMSEESSSFQSTGKLLWRFYLFFAWNKRVIYIYMEFLICYTIQESVARR